MVLGYRDLEQDKYGQSHAGRIDAGHDQKKMLMMPSAPAATRELAISQPAAIQEIEAISSHRKIQAMIGLP